MRMPVVYKDFTCCSWLFHRTRCSSLVSMLPFSCLALRMEHQKIAESLNVEFEEFFEMCTSNPAFKPHLRKICSALHYQLHLKLWKRIGFCVLLGLVFIWMCLNINFWNWTISALGRTIMIKMLPFWDWTYLYSADCLVSYSVEDGQTATYGADNVENVDRKDCALCENLNHIEVISDATFHYIERKYLEKGQPVVITDSHSPQPFHEFVERLISYGDYIETDPCDLETSFMLLRFANLDDLLRKADSSNAEDSWFFHLRNCRFQAVKASRKFIPKPHYYPSHLSPFYSSWLLMSKGIQASEKDLYVEGLIFVMQISGQREFTLTAKEPCFDACGQHRIILREGEAVVYTSDLWKLSYAGVNSGTAATVITETKWQ